MGLLIAPPLLLAALLLSPAPPLAAQGSTVTPQDLAQLLRTARTAQSRFELVRRRNLPWTNRSWGGECDERVGRFCLWHSGRSDQDWDPPEDPEEVVEAREDLVAVLDSVARRVPGDEWVSGHAVWYMVEAERFEDAVAVTERCRSPRVWWCTALRGFVLHRQGDYPASESAFEAALSVMASDERESWTSLEPLLEGDAWRHYRRLSGDKRGAFEARFWWLANPFFSVPGNDRRSEHFARSVIDHIQWRARQPEGLSWGGDLRTLLLRYGWPRGWERVRETGVRAYAGPPPIVSRYGTGRRFEPELAIVEAPFTTGVEDWDLDPPSPRASFRPPYAPRVDPLDHQAARFVRGDSIRLVTAYVWEETVDGEPAPGRAALAVSVGPSDLPRLVERSASPRGAFAITLGQDSVLVGLEVIPDSPSVARRARFGIAPPQLFPGVPALSDVLLLEAEAPETGELAEMERWARGSTRLASGEELGLYFELYQPDRVGESFQVTVSMEARDRSWLARLAERLRLREPEEPVRIRWTEEVGRSRDALPRSLRLRVPEAPPGRYWLNLQVDMPGREPLRTARAVEVAAP